MHTLQLQAQGTVRPVWQSRFTRQKWSVRRGEEGNTVVLNDGTQPIFGFLDSGNKKGTEWTY